LLIVPPWEVLLIVPPWEVLLIVPPLAGEVRRGID